MINPSEYRLGNIICWNPTLKDAAITLPALHIEIAAILPDKIGYVSPNIDHRVEYFEDGPIPKGIVFRSLEELEPVALIPTIIAQAGFVQSRLDVSNETGSCTFMYTEGELKYIEDQKELHFSCKYLHQLQNIFYALKGIELDLSGITVMA